MGITVGYAITHCDIESFGDEAVRILSVWQVVRHNIAVRAISSRVFFHASSNDSMRNCNMWYLFG